MPQSGVASIYQGGWHDVGKSGGIIVEIPVWLSNIFLLSFQFWIHDRPRSIVQRSLLVTRAGGRGRPRLIWRWRRRPRVQSIRSRRRWEMASKHLQQQKPRSLWIAFVYNLKQPSLESCKDRKFISTKFKVRIAQGVPSARGSPTQSTSIWNTGFNINYRSLIRITWKSAKHHVKKVVLEQIPHPVYINSENKLEPNSEEKIVLKIVLRFNFDSVTCANY